MASTKRKAPIFLKEESGLAILEFALSVPFLLVLILGLVELGGYIWQTIQVNNAVEAGVLYAVKNGWCTATGADGSCTTNTGAQVISAEQNAGIASVTMPTGLPICYYSCSDAGSMTTTSCGTNGGAGSVPPACGGTAPRQYVNVGATIPRLSLITGGTALLNLTLPDTITMTTWVRVQ
jgi:Flp pilus assembly protein TadG